MKLAIYSKESLQNHPVKISLTKGLESLDFDVFLVNSITPDTTCDCVLVFGGDGTMLSASTATDKPILGINLGNVGFLTQFEANVTAEEIASTLKSMSVATRNLITTTIDGNKLFALNDLTVKSISPRPIKLSLFVDGQFVDKYHADGIIVSTPTGSTAYSLSAGGPVLAPDMDAMVINPICPHSLHSRTLVVKGDSVIEIKVEDDAMIYSDGNEQQKIIKNNVIKIEKSTKTAQFVNTGNGDFYKKLLEKMNRWGTTC